jgi:hypothetical protein
MSPGLRVILLAFLPLLLAAAPKPVPRSPYLPLVYRYADTMLSRGRDGHGAVKTDLLLSALDRTTLAPLADRPLADPQRDQNLLRVLHTLSDLSGKPVYRAAADVELAWFLEDAAKRQAKLAPWDEGLAWDVAADKPVAAARDGVERPWMLWDRCFELAPGASRTLSLGLASAPDQSARRLGFSMRAWAAGYHHTKDDAFIRAGESAAARLEQAEGASSPERVSIAIDCAGAAGRFPGPLAARLRAIASREDQAFCGLPHDLAGKAGFARDAAASATTPLWQSRAADRRVVSTAAVAMMCVSRYENSGDVRYRRLIHEAADAYRRSMPPADADLAALDLGHAISLQLAAWRSTSRQEHLETATRLADLAVKQLWSDGPLPRAGLKAADYDAACGVDTLALALVELHLSILHITAVRCPPNTIDR